ncbi:MAG: type II secretion system protein [Desulfurivibrionaceae bacterium]|jgi:prepilin-type N-terminal cleavage/methylation domain-containing protein
MTQRGKNQNGFTLIELIMVIVLLGIVGAMGASFISEAFKGFFGADVRMEIYEEGKSALVRMEREIHIAVPNAVVVSDTTTADDTISVGLIDESAMRPVFGQYTEAHPTDGITDPTAALPVNTLVSIYNTSWDAFADSSRIYRVASLSGPGNRKMNFPEIIVSTSPYGRYYAVRPEAVRFSVANGVLSRSTATVTETNTVWVFGSPQSLAKNIVPSDGLPYFTYTPGTSSRNSMVAIHFAIARNDESVSFHKEIQIRNVP